MILAMGAISQLVVAKFVPPQRKISQLRADFGSCTLCTKCTGQLYAAKRDRVVGVLQVVGRNSGFGSQPRKKTKKGERKKQVRDKVNPIAQARQLLLNKQQENKNSIPSGMEAPNLDKVQQSLDIDDENVFELRLEEVKRFAKAQKEQEEKKKFAPVDYDAPLPTTQNGWTDNILVKIGAGVAVLVFGIIFAFGDILPSGSPNVETTKVAEKSQLSPEYAVKLQATAMDFETILSTAPNDQSALKGAALIYDELGQINKAKGLLTKLIQTTPTDVEALQLLGKVEQERDDYGASAVAYRSAIKASGKDIFILLKGLTDSLIADKKPNEAVEELLAARARLNSSPLRSLVTEGVSNPDNVAVTGDSFTQSYDQIGPVQVELLLGKSYAAWGHTADAVAVYDGLIATSPDDFRGYLAKGVLLRDQGKAGDAERMFIQARYLAPAEQKSVVDTYSGRRAR